MSLTEMALGQYPIPQPPHEEIIAELKEPMAGDLPPRQGGNPFASHANAIRMPIFELLQIITTSVSGRGEEGGRREGEGGDCYLRNI